MRNIWAIFKKELRAYFTSPIAYVVFTVFLLLSGWFFYNTTAAFNTSAMHYMRYNFAAEEMSVNEMVIRPLFYNVSIILLLMLPLFTMRLYAEEKKQGTIELLQTAPIANIQLVFGKFLGALFVYALMLAFSFTYPVILHIFGTPDWGPILTGYLGMLLMGAAYIAIGSLCSALTDSQIVAAVISFGVLLFLWVVSWASHFVGSAIGDVLSYISIIDHFEDFTKGIIDTKDVVFYLSFIIFSLFLTNETLELK